MQLVKTNAVFSSLLTTDVIANMFRWLVLFSAVLLTSGFNSYVLTSYPFWSTFQLESYNIYLLFFKKYIIRRYSSVQR